MEPEPVDVDVDFGRVEQAAVETGAIQTIAPPPF
jgi:hypothetical protein